MLTDVMGTLVYFGILFFIDIVLLGMALAVFGLNNIKYPGNFRKEFNGKEEYPGQEYALVGAFAGHIITTLRISMGDIDLAAMEYFDQAEQIFVWMIIFIIIGSNSIIFLNFIVAEATNTYNAVSE